jgi:hypothetical protein
MPENKNMPGAKPTNPASPGPKSWQEQLAAIKASGVAANRATSRATAKSGTRGMNMSGGAANVIDMGKSIAARVRGLFGQGFANGTTREKVLVTGVVVMALVVIGYFVGIPEWLKQRRENRQWTVVNNLTPERLIRRCGKPQGDETREVYPVIARDIRYESSPSATVILKFSRTAEESSDWVFMSMQDAATGATYDTPIAKITALSCLDSSK